MPETFMGRKDEATDRRHRVVVYGRLRRGQGAGLLDDSKFLGTVIIPATAPNDLVMLDAMDGAYPVVAAAKENGHEPQQIVVDLFAVNDETLKALDRLESVPHLFQRQKIKVRNRGQRTNVNIYVAVKDAFDLEGGKVVKDGDWSSHKRDAQEKEGAQLSREIEIEAGRSSEEGMTLKELYTDRNRLLPDQDESIWEYVAGKDVETRFQVRVIDRPGELPGMGSFKHATREQKRIVAEWKGELKKSPGSEIIVVYEDEVLDGHHRAVAAAQLGQTIKALDLSSPVDPKSS